MASHLSGRFHDSERREVYLDLIQSGLERPFGGEQAAFSTGSARPNGGCRAPVDAAPAPRTVPDLGFILTRRSS